MEPCQMTKEMWENVLEGLTWQKACRGCWAAALVEGTEGRAEEDTGLRAACPGALYFRRVPPYSLLGRVPARPHAGTLEIHCLDSLELTSKVCLDLSSAPFFPPCYCPPLCASADERGSCVCVCCGKWWLSWTELGCIRHQASANTSDGFIYSYINCWKCLPCYCTPSSFPDRSVGSLFLIDYIWHITLQI